MPRGTRLDRFAVFITAEEHGKGLRKLWSRKPREAFQAVSSFRIITHHPDSATELLLRTIKYSQDTVGAECLLRVSSIVSCVMSRRGRGRACGSARVQHRARMERIHVCFPWHMLNIPWAFFAIFLKYCLFLLLFSFIIS
jgi:hypothetical protein